MKSIKSRFAKAFSWCKRPFAHAGGPGRKESERELVEEFRKARISAFSIGPLLMLAGVILGFVLLGGSPHRNWKGTETILTLVVCVLWSGAGLALLLWATFWTPEAWARIVLEKSQRKRAKTKNPNKGAREGLK